MPKTAKALLQMPPQTLSALEALGAHLAVARMRRKQSLSDWAKRIGVSIPTLMRLESGDPSVGVGLFATALWLIGRDGELARIASPETDKGALELDVRKAMTLGRQRALAAQRSRITREQNVAKAKKPVSAKKSAARVRAKT